MKFGKKMIAAMRPEWGANVYVPYKALKQTLSLLADAETAARAEGAFVEQLMQSLQQVNRFYAGREVACAQLLRRLAKVLESPSRWLPAVAEVGRLSSEGVEVSLAALLPQLSTLDEEHAAALREFVDLCGELDLLRKYATINYLAVVKIVKKHDKHSPLQLKEAFAELVATQPFYTSTQLAATFTHAQCLEAELISAASGSAMSPERADYTCSICIEVLHMPVVLACTHRFCHGCLATACNYGNHCPLCMKETDLDPEGYDVDPVLTRFVAAHFAKSPKPSNPASPSASAIPALIPAPIPAAISTSISASISSARPDEVVDESAGGVEPAQAEAADSLADRADAAGAAGAGGGAVAVPAAGGSSKRPRPEEAAEAPPVKKRGSCTECYKAKAACIYDHSVGPCTRCTRLGRECTPHMRQPRRRRTDLAGHATSCCGGGGGRTSGGPMPEVQAVPVPLAPQCAAQPPKGEAPQRGAEAETDYFAPDQRIEDELDLSSDLLLSLSPAEDHSFLSLGPKDMASLLGDLEQISA